MGISCWLFISFCVLSYSNTSVLWGKHTSTKSPNNYEICRACASPINVSISWWRPSRVWGRTKVKERWNHYPKHLWFHWVFKCPAAWRAYSQKCKFEIWALFQSLMAPRLVVVFTLELISTPIGMLSLLKEVYILSKVFCVGSVLHPNLPSWMPTSALFLYPRSCLLRAPRLLQSQHFTEIASFTETQSIF